MNAKKVVTIILFYLLMAYPLYAGAVVSEPVDSGGTMLDSLVVTAAPNQSTIAGQQLSGKELDRLSALNVADAVRYFSGAQIKDYGGVGGVKTVDVRSMGSNHIGVFYDGIALGNAQIGRAHV